MEIKLKNVCKKINGNVILDNIDYTFTGGKIYGLWGKNGCGKTMMMRTVAGFIYPSSGEVCINGKTLGKDISFPESIGVLIENPSFLRDYTGFDNLKMLAEIQGNVTDEEIRTVLEQVGLSADDKKKFHKYSLGMRQRLGIAAAILGKPDVVLLDEPVNAIDESGVEAIRDVLRALVDDSRILILACHDREEMEYMADVILTMSEGKIVGEQTVEEKV